MNMKEPKHTANELKQMQSLPLDIKVQMSCRRIKEWYDYWEGDVYVSFSGGKDSTVLVDLVRNKCGLTDVPIVFVDTGLEFPEIKEFAKRYANTILRPNQSFKEILTNTGYPIISKEVAATVESANNYLAGKEKERELLNIPTATVDFAAWENIPRALKRMLGLLAKDNKSITNPYAPKKDRSRYNLERYKYLFDADFKISSKCCNIMKKKPCHVYEKETKRKPLLGTMAEESKQREQSWFKTGCNGFDAVKPKSTPLAFWTEQDVLQYIVENNMEIASVYGDIVQDKNSKYHTTGRDRTGCIFCMFGCHLEKEPNRFQRLKETHPKLYDYCINGGEYNEDGVWQPSIDGLGLGHVLDFIGVKYK